MTHHCRLIAVAFLMLCTLTPVSAQQKQTRATKQVASGDQFEHCSSSWNGQTVAFEFSATEQLEFEVHRHHGDALDRLIHDAKTRAMKDEFRVDKSGMYCLLWTNLTSKPIDVTFAVSPRLR